jgi:hypothetical protein
MGIGRGYAKPLSLGDPWARSDDARCFYTALVTAIEKIRQTKRGGSGYTDVPKHPVIIRLGFDGAYS